MNYNIKEWLNKIKLYQNKQLKNIKNNQHNQIDFGKININNLLNKINKNNKELHNNIYKLQQKMKENFKVYLKIKNNHIQLNWKQKIQILIYK